MMGDDELGAWAPHRRWERHQMLPTGRWAMGASLIHRTLTTWPLPANHG